MRRASEEMKGEQMFDVCSSSFEMQSPAAQVTLRLKF